MKIGLGIAVALVLAVLAWLFVAPVLTAQELQRALRDNDAPAIGRVVNFPALRENLRGTLGTQFAGQSGKATLEPGGVFGAALAGLMMGPIVDALVTPAGLSALFKGGAGAFTGQAAQNIRVSSGLQALNRHAITLTDLDNPASVVTLVLMPNGLQWQLTAINFAPDAFKR
jgi:hypothetical protein